MKRESGADPADWVINKGRMKFCRPVFRLLDKVDPELAKKTFKEHASFYVSFSIREYRLPRLSL